MSSSALTSVGPVRLLHEAPPVGVTVKEPAATLFTAVLDSIRKVTTIEAPVTTSDGIPVMDVKRPCGLRPGTNTSAPP